MGRCIGITPTNERSCICHFTWSQSRPRPVRGVVSDTATRLPCRPVRETSMRTSIHTSMLSLFVATAATSAPALSDRPPKWEYAELTYRTIPARPGGVDADGKEVAGTPASMTIRWVTGAGEVEAKGWSELAEKLRAPAFKKEGSAAFLKIQMLNYLGSEGWELMEQQAVGSAAARADPFGGRDRPAGVGFVSSSGSMTWLLKRRVP